MCLGLAQPPKSGVPIQVRTDSGASTCSALILSRCIYPDLGERVRRLQITQLAPGGRRSSGALIVAEPAYVGGNVGSDPPI